MTQRFKVLLPTICTCLYLTVIDGAYHITPYALLMDFVCSVWEHIHYVLVLIIHVTLFVFYLQGAQAKAANEGMDDGLADLGAGAGAEARAGGELKFRSKTQFVMATSKKAEEENRGEKDDAVGGKNASFTSVVSIHHTFSTS